MKIITVFHVISEFINIIKQDKINVLSFITNNFGDYYNKILIETIVKKKVHIVDINIYKDLKLKYLYHGYEIISGIGSIIHYADENTVIWGSGSIWYNSVPQVKPKEVLSIRGKLTRKNLTRKGYKCPEIYGDPGLLIKKYTGSSGLNDKRYELGIIPHYSEKNLPVINELRKNPDIKIIDIEDENNLIQDIMNCGKIASSSLHGLIFSDSFQIPNIWISFSDRVYGGHFKFHDYYSSIYQNSDSVIENMKPIKIFSSQQYREILKCATIKRIDLNVDLIDYQLKSYLNIV